MKLQKIQPRKNKTTLTSLAFLMTLSLGACGQEGGGALPTSDTCVSGYEWTGGEEESPLMKPGGNCIECHASRGEGPRYLAAGTVFAESDEPDDCGGVEGVTVVLEDADGVEVRLETNAAGNFFRQTSMGELAFPVHARVEGPNGTRAMSAELNELNCMTCHTAQGERGAPGRILAP